jgi:hypothetical protein
MLLLRVDEFGWALYVVGHPAGTKKPQRRPFVADEAQWLSELAALDFPEATQVLVWYHLSENVHTAAEALFGEATEQAKNF